MPANKENKILGIVLSAPDQLSESGGVKRTARGIKEDFARSWMPGEQVKPPRNNLAHVAGCVTAAPFLEFRGNGVCVRIARFTDVIQEEFQM